MKRIQFNRMAAAALIAGALHFSLNESPAQPDGKKRPATAEEAARFRRTQMAGGAASRFGPGFERLQSILTEDQRASLREAMEGQREKMRDLEENIREARKDLLMAGLTEKLDEEEVRGEAYAVAKLEAEMTVLRAKAFFQMRPRLGAEQLEKLKAPPVDRGKDQPEASKRRRDIRRDEHGLPLRGEAAPKPDTSDPAPAPKPPQP